MLRPAGDRLFVGDPATSRSPKQFICGRRLITWSVMLILAVRLVGVSAASYAPINLA